MAKGKENTNPRSDFEVETIIGSLDKMHYILLKEGEEIKERLVYMAKQRAEFELIMQRKDEQLIRAQKEIEDLNKENEQLKRTQLHLEKCFRRCSGKLKRMPFSEIQQEKNCRQSVSRPQEEKEIVDTPKTGRQNDGECERSFEASSTLSSSKDLLPESMDCIPAYCYKTDELALKPGNTDNPCHVKSKEQHLSVPSGPEFPSPTIQQLTSDGDFKPQVTAFNSVISSGHSSRQQDVVPDIRTQFQTPEHCSRHQVIVPEFVDYLPVYKTEDHHFEAEQSSSLELAGPSIDVFNSSEVVQEPEHVQYLPVHRIKVEQLDDEQVFQLVDVDSEESSSTQFQPYVIAKREQTGQVTIASQSEPSEGQCFLRIKRIQEEPAKKRIRTAFTGDQLARLKQEFAENRYLKEKRRKDLARDLKLNELQIKIWFQNKRAMIKKTNRTLWRSS